MKLRLTVFEDVVLIKLLFIS